MATDLPQCKIEELNFDASGTRILTSQTSSNSIQLINDDKFIKVSFCEDDDNSLEYERNVYRFFSNELLNQQVSPHFVRALSWFQCSDTKIEELVIPEELKFTWRFFLAFVGISAVMSNPQLPKLMNAIEKKLAGVGSDEREEKRQTYLNSYSLKLSGNDRHVNNLTRKKCLQGIVLEKTQGIALENFAIDTVEKLKVVLFQVIYTLSAMEQVGLAHNDLHFANLFVDTLADGLKRLYVPFGGTRHAFLLDTTIDVKFFDWDRAFLDCEKADEWNNNLSDNFKKSVSAGGGECDNTTLLRDYCTLSGQCNRKDAYRIDLWMILYYLKIQIEKESKNEEVLTKFREFKLRHCSKTIAALEKTSHQNPLSHNAAAADEVVKFDESYWQGDDEVPRLTLKQMLGAKDQQMTEGAVTNTNLFPKTKPTAEFDENRAWMHVSIDWLNDTMFEGFKVELEKVDACRQHTYSLPNIEIAQKTQTKIFKNCENDQLKQKHSVF